MIVIEIYSCSLWLIYTCSYRSETEWCMINLMMHVQKFMYIVRQN